MRRIEFSAAPRADVALLKRNLEFWPVFREVVSGFSTIELETVSSPLNIRDLAPVVRDLISKKTTLGYASIAARFHKSGARVLLAADQVWQVADALNDLLPSIPQVLVAHGTQRSEIMRHYYKVVTRPGRVLCVWGQSDVDLYREVSRDGVECRVVGSLRNADYLRLYPLQMDRVKRHHLLFVSQYSGQEEDNPSPTSKRNQILLSLKNHLRQYCAEHSLELTVALRPPVSAPHVANQVSEEIAHYVRVFADIRLHFTDPSMAYATYLASDESDVTIGVPSGTLTESFGRGNKVLMFRQSPESGSYYGFPVEGAWLVTEPTYEQFAERLDFLRGQPRAELVAQWREAREYVLANAESDSPLRIVRDLVTRSVNGERV
jgi:hypothetical protein